MNASIIRNTTRALIVCLLGAWLPVHSVSAALIGTAELSAPAASAERERVRSFLQREDVRGLLQQQGLDAGAALGRVDAMTDAEVQTLAARLDTLPAGGDVLGILFATFVILLVTDILGFTKVFPFTRPVR